MAVVSQKAHPLPRPGIRQPDRTIPALDPARLRLEDRGRKEQIEFAQKYSELIRFKRLVDVTGADADWTPFFDKFDFDAYALLQRDFETDFTSFSQSPHGGLYSVYLKLLGYLYDDLNKLPKKHLDFYYEKILRLAPRKAETDRVHVVFEPVKNKDIVQVPAQTKLDAGKAIVYETANEIFVSQAQIVSKHSIFADPALTDLPRVAFEAESLDGIGEPLTEDQPNWKPFGSPGMPVLETGFAIASPVMALQEGERTITVTIELRYPSGSPELTSDDNLRNSLIAELSGEEEWLGPFTLVSASAKSVGDREVKVVFSIEVAADEDPIAFHDVSKLEGGFDTVSPVLKLSLSESADVRIARLFARSKVLAIQIDVSVDGAKEFDLENDLGRLNPDKPFMPFGPQPVVGSSFYVSSEELLAKKLTDFKLRITWQDVPVNLAKHYGAYRKDKVYKRPPKLKQSHLGPSSQRYVSSNAHFNVSMSLVKRGQQDKSVTVGLFDRNDATQTVELDSTPDIRPFSILPYVMLAGYFSKAALNVKALFPGTVRFISKATSPVSRKRKRARARKRIDLRVRLPNARRKPFRVRRRKFGVIRVTLKQHFFHRLYPYFLAATIADEDSEVSPLEPYTPVVESMELDYKATVRYEKFNNGNAANYQQKPIQLFHLTPFGHAEQHAFLKRDLPFASDTAIRLIPHFSEAGSLIMGVDQLEEGESISLLIRVAQGTANPLKERQKVQWSLLVRNHWRPFEQSEVLVDETNQLLTSGIVRLKIPNEPLHDNTLFNPDLTWIRASVVIDSDAVCDFRAIHTHAVTATIAGTDSENASGAIAAGTIAKLKSPVAAIKSVTQPYASFGGRPAESTDDFYRRTSERLRHKQRTVTAADYEHLVLQEFPQLHMVRCLTHSDVESCHAPGEVTLIVIPNTPPEARFDRLKPRADLDTLSKIADHVNAVNTHQITVDVRNPTYEEVGLALSVRFYSDRPFAPYRTVLNEDLVKYLSPWVSNAEVMPAFGSRLHKSQIIKFIEDLDYVDFVTDVRLFRSDDSAADLTSVQPSSPDAILVSVSQHTIDEAEARP